MIPITIDATELGQQFNLSQKEIDGLMSFIVKGVTARFAMLWEEQAEKNLKSTRNEYIRSIYVGEEGPFVGFVKLTGMLPNMVEQGSQPYDEKEFFGKSDKRKFNKKGEWYLTIPFRHAWAGALGESSVFTNILPNEIWSIVKNFEPPSNKGERLNLGAIPGEYAIPKVRPEIVVENKVFEEYTHKNSIYEGLQREEQKYSQASQGQYVTFRRVSENASDSNSWINGGIQAYNLAEKALDKLDIGREGEIAVDNYLQSIGR